MDNRENQTDILFEKTAEILKVSDWKCRKIAAQALAAINSKHPIFTVKKLMENLSNGQNYSHGILLAVLELLKKTDEKLDFRLDQKVFLGLHSHSKDLLCKIVRIYGGLSSSSLVYSLTVVRLRITSAGGFTVFKEPVNWERPAQNGDTLGFSSNFYLFVSVLIK